jgi:Flp pilus assembly protein TadG
MVEFALIAPLLFFLLFSVIEISLMFWANLTMQYAVREGARYAITGRKDLDPSASDQQRYRAIIAQIRNNSMGLYDRLQPAIRVNNSGPYTAPTFNAGMFGGPGDIIVMQIDCAWPVFTPLLAPFFQDGRYRFSVAATMRNEVFQE